MLLYTSGEIQGSLLVLQTSTADRGSYYLLEWDPVQPRVRLDFSIQSLITLYFCSVAPASPVGTVMRVVLLLKLFYSWTVTSTFYPKAEQEENKFFLH